MNQCRLQVRIGMAMRLRRENLGFSQEAFADHISMHRAYYGALERGEKNVQLKTLERVAAGMKLTAGELVSSAEMVL
jgi:transcriptional regulator with XRE-family HTH domain